LPSNRKILLTVTSTCLLALLVTIPLLANAGALERLFAPKPELWDAWLAHDDTSHKSISHQDWDTFLKSSIRKGGDGITRIAYAGLPESDRKKLRAYIEAMQATRISKYSRNEQLVYWINLYNAVTVDIILSHYPVESIRDIDISPGFFSDGPWGKQVLNIEGRALSLNDIEHRILRPVWQDARIHYVLNCASLGCPNLRQRAYTTTAIEEQLDIAAKEYIAHPRGVRIAGDGVYVSSIYNWFQKDFGDTEADVIKHIQGYTNAERASKLDGIKFFAGDDYDWSLNDALVIQP